MGPVCPLRGSCWLHGEGDHVSPWSCTFRCAWYKTFPIKARSTPASRRPRTPVSHPQPLGKGMAWSQRPGQAWGDRPGEESESEDPSGESLWLRQEPGAACPGRLTPAPSSWTHLCPRALPTLVQHLLRCVYADCLVFRRPLGKSWLTEGARLVLTAGVGSQLTGAWGGQHGGPQSGHCPDPRVVDRIMAPNTSLS